MVRGGRRCGQGFTLVELIVAISIIGIALLGVTYALQFSVRYSADPLWQAKTQSLAMAYTEEILAQAYDQTMASGTRSPCQPCTAEQRFGPDQEQRGGGVNTFNDVDDYHGLNERTLNVLGQPRPGYDNYWVAVQVHYAGEDFQLEPHQLKRIELSITPPGQKPQSFVFYRGNF